MGKDSRLRHAKRALQRLINAEAITVAEAHECYESAKQHPQGPSPWRPVKEPAK
jgi:hypothetical protein